MAEQERSGEADKKASESSSQHAQNKAAVKSKTPWPLVTIGVFLTVVVLAVGITSWAWMSAAVYNFAQEAESRTSDSINDNRRQFGYGERGWMFPDEEISEMTTAASGVIVKIEGGTLTVAGQGKQVLVKTTDDTVIRGDKDEIALNDTVLIYGEIADDDTVTAERIVIHNETVRERFFEQRRSVPHV